MTESGEANSEPPSLRIEYTEMAEAELDAAYEWMLRFGFAVAERWRIGLIDVLQDDNQ